MADSEEIYDGNREEVDNYAGGSSPQPDGDEEHSDSKSQQGSWDYGKRSSSRRDKGGDKERGGDHDRDRVRDRHGERSRDKDKDMERTGDRDHDRHHRDWRRDPSERRERGRDRDDEYYRSRDYDRRSDYDRDREERHRRRSHTRSPSLSRDKSKHRSRSCSRSKSKRISGFDMAPPAAAISPVPGATPTVPGLFPKLFSLPGQQFGAVPVMPVQAMTQQATRHARRVYVGGLPPTANEQAITNAAGASLS